MTSTDPLQLYLDSARQQFEQYREMAEKAITGISDSDLACRIDPESNSISTLLQHMAGNLVSRWTDFLTTDGEKSSRRRDAEFEDGALERTELMAEWNRGWSILFEALEKIRTSDLTRTVTIRAKPLTVTDAINRQLTHYAYHVGQIVFLAKHFQGAAWQTLSIARHRSPQ